MPLPQPNAPSDLLVRQHERLLCRLAARVHLVPEDAPQVSLARAIGDGAGGLGCVVVDCSSGGLGLQSTVFIPRGARLDVKISAEHVEPGEELARPASGAIAREIFSGSFRVQRVTMIDRTPRYYIGAALIKASGAQSITDLLAHVRNNAEGGTRAQ